MRFDAAETKALTSCGADDDEVDDENSDNDDSATSPPCPPRAAPACESAMAGGVDATGISGNAGDDALAVEAKRLLSDEDELKDLLLSGGAYAGAYAKQITQLLSVTQYGTHRLLSDTCTSLPVCRFLRHRQLMEFAIDHCFLDRVHRNVASPRMGICLGCRNVT